MSRNKYIYYDENGNCVKAFNYTDAAEKLYGQEEYTLPEYPGKTFRTTCSARLKGYGYVWVREIGGRKVKVHILKKKH